MLSLDQELQIHIYVKYPQINTDDLIFQLNSIFNKVSLIVVLFDFFQQETYISLVNLKNIHKKRVKFTQFNHFIGFLHYCILLKNFKFDKVIIEKRTVFCLFRYVDSR